MAAADCRPARGDYIISEGVGGRVSLSEVGPPFGSSYRGDFGGVQHALAHVRFLCGIGGWGASVWHRRSETSETRLLLDAVQLAAEAHAQRVSS